MMISPQSSAMDGALRDFFSTDPGSPLPDTAPGSAVGSSFAAFQRIVEITAAVFGQQPAIQHDYNPEFPEEKYLVLKVELPPDRTLMLEKEAAWTREVATVEPPLDMVRLSIKPQK